MAPVDDPPDRGPLPGVTVREVADELVRCRRRGLARLDAVLGSEAAVDLPVLDRLAAGHRRSAPDRGVAIGTLVKRGAAALGTSRPEDARLVTELFFGDPDSTIPVLSPGELLDAAVRRRPGLNEATFRRERRQVYLRLGRVLLDLVEVAPPLVDPRVQTSASAVLALAQDPDADNDQIMDRLREMAREYDVSEVLEVIVRFDTPDILG